MSEIQADGADHEPGKDVIEEIVEMEVDYPEWFAEGYEDLKAFLALTQEERTELVGEASGVYGTVLASLSPEGQAALVSSGNAFAAANFQSLKDKFGEMGATDFLLLLLGVSVECLGIQQLKIKNLRKQ